MKWIALAVAILAMIPLAAWLRANPREITKVWIFVGLAPFVSGTFHLDMSMIDWAGWPGYAKGMQISLLDIVAITLLFILPREQNRLPFRLAMALYFLAVVLSVFQAQIPMAAFFYVWQLARMFLVYAVVARGCTDTRVATAVLTGFAIGLCYETLLALWQRFGLGILQTPGSFGHQNSLGMVSQFAVFPLFALLLAGERRWWISVAPAAGLLVAVLTTSRATLGLTVIGLVLLFVLSSFSGWTARKAAVLATGIFAVIVLSPLAVSSFAARFAEIPLSDAYDERAAFEKAAANILSARPLGAGANNYVVVANTGGYLDQAGVAASVGSRSTFVHNAYWVAAAETGYLGVAAFMILLFAVTARALRRGWKYRREFRGSILLGLGVSLLVVLAHNNYEWIFFYPFTQYLFAITAGMVAALAGQLGHRRPPLAAHSSRLFLGPSPSPLFGLKTREPAQLRHTNQHAQKTGNLR